ncbi:hypothetical protein C8T65DRAFT_71641 [Cerioporus squamosus]|nr:hypothetical protein C8T65DRAFT_71641 [Cerioporus squamosus]
MGTWGLRGGRIQRGRGMYSKAPSTSTPPRRAHLHRTSTRPLSLLSALDALSTCQGLSLLALQDATPFRLRSASRLPCDCICICLCTATHAGRGSPGPPPTRLPSGLWRTALGCIASSRTPKSPAYTRCKSLRQPRFVRHPSPPSHFHGHTTVKHRSPTPPPHAGLVSTFANTHTRQQTQRAATRSLVGSGGHGRGTGQKTCVLTCHRASARSSSPAPRSHPSSAAYSCNIVSLA